MRAGIEWGCPFVLYWQIYNNEVYSDGGQRGFWMIDDKGKKQPIYRTHFEFFRAAREYVAAYYREQRRVPTAEEFRSKALTLLNGSPSLARSP